MGIIPARAGFTHSGTVCCWPRPDHPRSRGVYLDREVLSRAVSGSSPLARGLQHRVQPVLLHPRIIPARAGFTSRRDGHLHGAQDHPRSRGVYVPAWLSLHTVPGSSPLARGLLRGLQDIRRCRVDHPRSRGVYDRDLIVHAVNRWIIPARAGFTKQGGMGRPSGWDHPRSRGVYDNEDIPAYGH